MSQDYGPEEPMLLMTPGPTRVPPRVRQAGARPMLHHRTPEFSGVLSSMLDGLRVLFGASGDVLPVHTTGRGAMEASICNLFSPGDELVVCCNGKFGEMWAGFAESYGLVVHRICTRWTRSVDVAEVEAALDAHPQARAVALVHSDTSTGVLNDVEAVFAITRSRGILGMVDCISGLGGVPFRFDDWGADVAVTASQKCLMSSAGLAFVALSERAWEADAIARLPHNYWDFRAIRKSLDGPRAETPGTTPVHLVVQVDEALKMIREEGVEQVYARHEAMASHVRQRVAGLGLALQTPTLDRFTPTLTALLPPEGREPRLIREGLRSRGILVAGGLGQYSGSAFRIGHLGDIRMPDIERTLDALEEVLEELPRVSSREAAQPLTAR